LELKQLCNKNLDKLHFFSNLIPHFLETLRLRLLVEMQ